MQCDVFDLFIGMCVYVHIGMYTLLDLEFRDFVLIKERFYTHIHTPLRAHVIGFIGGFQSVTFDF